jgi:type II secretory pathway predicted ATPase ExeA
MGHGLAWIVCCRNLGGHLSTITEQEDEKLFENEVRRIARELWPDAEHDGSRMIEGRERDGVFETEDCVHLVECTVSHSKQKADDDSKKLVSLAKKLQPKNSQKAIKSWFITKDEPTADQRTVIKDKYAVVTVLAFAQFQSKLMDAASYLNLRNNYPFGSVRDPATGKVDVPVDYIALDLLERPTQKPWSIAEIKSEVLTGGRFTILGDYGSGKSMTLREVFRELRAAYLKGKTAKFPVYLNLRDHLGQIDPAEVLERHARNIGFPNPSHLVRAWRAGYVVLLIDGFDELTTLGIQGLWKRLHDARFRAMEVVRKFVREQPREVGIILAGREHFFNSEKERRSALNASSASVDLALNEFNDEQIQRYLAKKGLKGSVPNWMPSRPLLVGYLAASGVLEQAFSPNRIEKEYFASDPVRGWDFIVDRVCAREAEIEAGIDGPTVRRILERLATIARQSQSGLGPLSPEMVSGAFSEICGYQPDEKGYLLLQRLPGLGTDRAEEGTRIFLDEDFADICRAGDILLYISDPFGVTLSLFKGADRGLGDLGVGLILARAGKAGLTSGKMVPAIRKAIEIEEYSSLAMDLVRVSIEFGCAIEIPVCLKGVYVPFLELHEQINDCSKLRFENCLFSRLALDHGVVAAHLPRFADCYIDEVDGRSSAKDLPLGILDKDCEFGHFSESPETTSAIGGMDLPIGVRVLLTVLKKTYLQSGSGRKENALQRGLDHHSRRLVGQVLHLLQSEGIISPYRRAGLDMTIWIPDRSKTARVQRLIASPRTCGDSLIVKAGELS